MSNTERTALADFYANLAGRASNPDFELPTVRDVLENIHAAAAEPEGVTYAEVDADGVAALWCIPLDSDPQSVILHSHLGGTVLMSRHTDRKAAAHIAKAAGIRSLVVDYRRSPEHKHPAQIQDVETAYRWLLGQGYAASNIASVGHSIGGYLAVELAVRLRERGEALPGAVLSISPWADVTLLGASIEANAERDKLLTRGLLELFRSCWLDGTGIEFTDPAVNLLHADLSGLPPTAIYYGEHELLSSDAINLAEHLKQAGNELVVYELAQGQHSFIMGAGRDHDIDCAIEVMGAWLRTTLGLNVAAVAK